MTEIARAVWVISYREFLRFIQDRARSFSSFAMPILFLVIFGAGFGELIGQLMPGINFTQYMYPGIIAMTVLMTSVFTGLSIVWDREFGFLKEVLVAPLNRSGIILGKAVGAAVVAVIQSIIMLALAPIVGVSLDLGLVLTLIPVVIILSISLSGLGILIASRMRSQQGFQLLMQLLIFPMIFLSGVFFPLTNVPAWLEVLSKVNPVTYGVDAIRQVFLGSEAATASLFGHTMSVLENSLIVGAVGLILLSLSVWVFNKQE